MGGERTSPRTTYGADLVDAASLASELPQIRHQQYASESQENELGISCLAVPVFVTSSSIPSGAISIKQYVTPHVSARTDFNSYC